MNCLIRNADYFKCRYCNMCYYFQAVVLEATRTAIRVWWRRVPHDPRARDSFSVQERRLLLRYLAVRCHSPCGSPLQVPCRCASIPMFACVSHADCVIAAARREAHARGQALSRWIRCACFYAYLPELTCYMSLLRRWAFGRSHRKIGRTYCIFQDKQAHTHTYTHHATVLGTTPAMILEAEKSVSNSQWWINVVPWPGIYILRGQLSKKNHAS